MSTVLLPDTPITSLDEYVASRDGGAALEQSRSVGAQRVLEEIDRSGLRGRGGAGFPAGRKWAAIAAGGPAVGRRYVAANGAEGEPGSFKDRLLMARNPYQVLEGIQIAAEAVGAEAAFVALKASFVDQIDALSRALREMVTAGMLGSIPITIVTGPDEYLFGEEKALLEVIEGEDPLPRLFPPYLYGLFTTSPQMGWSAGSEVADMASPDAASNPTLATNVETLANVPAIVRHGADWYRGFGTPGSPGVALFTVVGDTRRAAVRELELGTPLADVLERVGGGMRDGAALKMVLSGVANPVVRSDLVETPASYEAMEGIGSGLGACGFIAYDDSRDAVSVAQMVSRFLYVESCGQCPACKFGTGEITSYLDRIVAGAGDERDVEQIGARLRTVTDANRCFLGEQEQRVIGSLLRAFPEDFAAHLGVGGTETLPVPKIIEIVDEVARYDEKQAHKRPDWTYADAPLGHVVDPSEM